MEYESSGFKPTEINNIQLPSGCVSVNIEKFSCNGVSQELHIKLVKMSAKPGVVLARIFRLALVTLMHLEVKGRVAR